MFGSATLTIDVSMIAMITPSMTVTVTSATGGSRASRGFGTVASRTGSAAGRVRSGSRDAMTSAPVRVLVGRYI